MLSAETTIDKNKKLFLFSLIATFLWGFAAHGYVFMQANFSHDSLLEFDGEVISNSLKYMSGRYLVPLSRALFRTDLTLPWLVGLLSLIWIGIAVFLTAKIFRVQSRSTVFLIAGCYSANLTVSCTAACFLHDLDADMLALLFSVAAVYIWQKERWYWLPGALCVAASIALYQSYVLVTVVLVMFLCILDTMNGKTLPKVFLGGVKAIAMLLLGGVFYFIGLKAVMKIVGFQTMTGQFQTAVNPQSMSPDTLLYVFRETYAKYFKRMATVLSPYPDEVATVIFFLLVLGILAALCIGLCNRRTPVLQKLLCIGLVCLLPFAMNMLHMIYPTHELMRFSYWLTYVLALLMADWLVRWLQEKFSGTVSERKQALLKLPKFICAALVALMMYSNVQVANVFYLKKDLEHESYASLMTRVVYRIESHEEYKPGSTPVVLVGLPEHFNRVIPGFEDYTMPNGVQTSDVLTFMTKDRAQAYFDYYLNTPILLADEAIWDMVSKDPALAQMPNYPDAGCIAMIDGVLVAKLGDSDH